MQNQNVLKHHAHLVDQMANTLGIALEEAAMRGRISIDEISDAVLRCTGCSNAAHCEGWLEERTQGSDRTPDYCRNSDLFAELQVKSA